MPTATPRARERPVDLGPRVRRALGPERLLQRSPDEPGEASAERTRVEEATRLFTGKATELGGESVTVDAAKFELEIDTLYRSVIGAESTINVALSGDAALRVALRKAYTDAIRVLVAKRAADAGASEADLYRQNSGRIPMWAWPEAHRAVADISTPIAESATVDAKTGEATFSSNGYAVTIARDGTDASLTTSAATRLNVTWCKASLMFESEDEDAKITAVNRRGPMCAKIQTFYKPPATAAGPSAFGRGTTPEDIAGGRVTPHSTSLGFHEGMHGLDFVDFLKKNKPPAFPGRVGLTRTQLKARANAQFKALQDAAVAASAASHCVGKTIDEHAEEQGIPGHVIECSSPEEEKKSTDTPTP